MKRSGMLVLALAAPLFGACAGATEPLDYEDFYKADGEGELGIWVHSGLYNRPYTVHTPPGMDESGSYPLLIFLHGGGDSGEPFRNSIRPHAVTDSAGFITVFPDGMEGQWTIGCNDCNIAEKLEAGDVSFLETLSDHLTELLPVDPERIYLAGFAAGGLWPICTAAPVPSPLPGSR